MKALLLAMLLVPGAWGQEDSSSVSFHFARPGLAVTEYTLKVWDDGTGSYVATQAGPASANKYSVEPLAAATHSKQEVHLTDAMRGRLFGLVQATHGLRSCDAHRKGIADTGAKTLTVHTAYENGEKDLSCTYNYSEDKAVVELTNLFQAMAVTLDMGRKMASDEKYDRLALDGDMTLLVEEVKDGRAAGVSNIRETLKGIAEDAAVLERVKVRAGKLLEFSSIEK